MFVSFNATRTTTIYMLQCCTAGLRPFERRNVNHVGVTVLAAGFIRLVWFYANLIESRIYIYMDALKRLALTVWYNSKTEAHKHKHSKSDMRLDQRGWLVDDFSCWPTGIAEWWPSFDAFWIEAKSFRLIEDILALTYEQRVYRIWNVMTSLVINCVWYKHLGTRREYGSLDLVIWLCL